MNLVIVESPAKGKTIEKYLGKDYRVLASFGHVRDLPKSKLGVDVDKDFEPQYVIPPKSKKVISALKNAILQANKVYLATDHDREGEAIAWHVAKVAGLLDSKKKDFARITFNEITKNAITAAVAKPRTIDMHLVDAQQARRILDRLVGYKLSPFLWKKLFKGLSAGRVQSVAVRLIVEKEREIQKFVPTEYWTVGAILDKDKKEFQAIVREYDGKKIDKMAIKTEVEANGIDKALAGGKYIVSGVVKKETKRMPYAPFTTSTMQQDAAHKLHFSAKQTMKLAQDLYEAGHITYMRTDSLNISQEALNATRELIGAKFGKDYLPEASRVFKNKSKGAQEAHEAIRPTHIELDPEQLNASKFEDKHIKLYDLIRRRMMASQMNPAIFESMQISIDCGKAKLVANGSRIVFDGFLKVWPTDTKENILPEITKGDELAFVKAIKEQHFTKPPARYSEATLVKTLEEYGIGRPSTYAPIISTIQQRGYVKKEAGKFMPNESAFLVTDLLVENFPEVVDVDFTAGMEKQLDDIAEDKLSYVKMLSSFYGPFVKKIDEKVTSVEKVSVEEKSDKKCPKCGKELVYKMGRFGKFLACTGFPECKHTEQVLKTIGMNCPDCGKGEIIERHTRRGKTFWGCSNYPKCKWASWNNPMAKKEEEGEGENSTEENKEENLEE